jgi:hypothetical protein
MVQQRSSKLSGQARVSSPASKRIGGFNVR